MSYQLNAPMAKNVNKLISVDFNATEASVKVFIFSAEAKMINFTVEFSNAAGESKLESYEVAQDEFEVLVSENIGAIIGVRESVWSFLRKKNLIGSGVDKWPL